MKKRTALSAGILAIMLTFTACTAASAGANSSAEKPVSSTVVTQAAGADESPAPHPVVTTPQEAIEQLKSGNLEYLSHDTNTGDISDELRTETATNGQHPYAIVVTCSDSRVPAEEIFNAGIGDIFVIRTAGNVIDKFELGSIEYGAEHLGAKVVLVMGHSGCGAVAAAIDGGAEGNIISIVEEVKEGIGSETDKTAAENMNIAHSYEKVLESEIVNEKLETAELAVVQAKYDIATGEVDFIAE